MRLHIYWKVYGADANPILLRIKGKDEEEMFTHLCPVYLTPPPHISANGAHPNVYTLVLRQVTGNVCSVLLYSYHIYAGDKKAGSIEDDVRRVINVFFVFLFYYYFMGYYMHITYV